jgi:trehalose synthase
MTDILDRYNEVTGPDVVRHLRQLAAPLRGLRVLHVNSTREGGGVAEILRKLVPLKNALGIDTKWEVVTGKQEFYRCTKQFHNALQGRQVVVSERRRQIYERTNRKNAETLRRAVEEADIIIIHDPQPLSMIGCFPQRRGKWIWRCHIDLSKPNRLVWNYLKKWVVPFDASIFHLPAFARRLPHPVFFIPPSIDPLSDKNIELPDGEVEAVRSTYGIDSERPLVVQVSRFDTFKDPVGVMQAFFLARGRVPLQLVLAGGTATDDPEGALILREVNKAAKGEKDIHVLALPPDAHRTINALQRAADIVLQKSLREGFGLTVTEAMWKRKPVIGGDVGGIRLQVVNHYTGFLVRTVEGAALRMRYLLHRRGRLAEMGERAHRHVLENFLLTRHLRDYLALMIGVLRGEHDRIEVGPV